MQQAALAIPRGSLSLRSWKASASGNNPSALLVSTLVVAAHDLRMLQSLFLAGKAPESARMSLLRQGLSASLSAGLQYLTCET